jgi:DNA adenine methylase
MTPPLKWHGGKHYIASRIIDLFPPHTHYVEPFAGGLSVLLARDPAGDSEVVNDLDLDLTNFWTVLQHGRLFTEFHRRVSCVPFSSFEWADARAYLDCKPRCELGGADINRAVAFFVCCRQSLAGRMESFATLSRTRVRRGMNEQASAWLNAIEGLPEVHARLARVVILTGNALEVIRSQDGPDTLFYLDPPYMPDARTAPDVYRHEMDRPAHVHLLELLSQVKGKFVLSGYSCKEYDAFSERLGWHRISWKIANHSAGGKAKRQMVEVCWMNFKPKAKE